MLGALNNQIAFIVCLYGLLAENALARFWGLPQILISPRIPKMVHSAYFAECGVSAAAALSAELLTRSFNSLLGLK